VRRPVEALIVGVLRVVLLDASALLSLVDRLPRLLLVASPVGVVDVANLRPSAGLTPRVPN
jgi:hypothetical protein